MTNCENGPTIRAPEGFRSIASAPRDGTFVRLRFRPGVGRETWETAGQWRALSGADLPGGAWFDRDGNYVTPGPLFWAPEQGQWQ